jgi:hypothetical protein
MYSVLIELRLYQKPQQFAIVVKRSNPELKIRFLNIDCSDNAYYQKFSDLSNLNYILFV